MIHEVIQKWTELTLGTITSTVTGKNYKSSHLIFFTVSPSSSFKVECLIKTQDKRVKKRISYDKLSLVNQKIFLNRYFDKVYKPIIESYIYIYELNKSGNLHIHGLICDPEIRGSEYDLLCFRDSINKHYITLSMVKNPKLFKILNNIVYVEDIEHVKKYLSKDLNDSIKHFGYMSKELFKDAEDDDTITNPTIYFQ